MFISKRRSRTSPRAFPQGAGPVDGTSISLGGELRWVPSELDEELRLQRWRCAAVDCQAGPF